MCLSGEENAEFVAKKFLEGAFLHAVLVGDGNPLSGVSSLGSPRQAGRHRTVERRPPCVGIAYRNQHRNQMD